MTTSEGRRRPRRLSAETKWEIYLQVTSGEAALDDEDDGIEAAFAHAVLMRLCRFGHFDDLVPSIGVGFDVGRVRLRGRQWAFVETQFETTRTVDVIRLRLGVDYLIRLLCLVRLEFFAHLAGIE